MFSTWVKNLLYNWILPFMWHYKIHLSALQCMDLRLYFRICLGNLEKSQVIQEGSGRLIKLITLFINPFRVQFLINSLSGPAGFLQHTFKKAVCLILLCLCSHKPTLYKNLCTEPIYTLNYTGRIKMVTNTKWWHSAQGNGLHPAHELLQCFWLVQASRQTSYCPYMNYESKITLDNTFLPFVNNKDKIK